MGGAKGMREKVKLKMAPRVYLEHLDHEVGDGAIYWWFLETFRQSAAWLPHESHTTSGGTVLSPPHRWRCMRALMFCSIEFTKISALLKTVMQLDRHY